MKLFDIDIDTNEVKLNKPWIFLVPELAEILKRDKGSPGDVRGTKKLRATKQFTYIYFMVDFGSPLRDYELSERHKESLIFAGLQEKDIDDGVRIAMKKYEELFLAASRSLRTYKAMLKTQDAMDDYFENLDFTVLDKKGELRNDPSRVADTIVKTSKMHTAIADFAKKVEEELTAVPATIRGAAELGDREGKPRSEWSESEIGAGSERSSQGSNNTPAFTGLQALSHKTVLGAEISDEDEDD